MHISVLVPTYRRPVDLQRCLAALARQERPADAVIVVCRPDDQASLEVLARVPPELPLKRVHVTVTGVVAALNAGLANVTGDVVAMTDDDAAPRADWLARIEAHYENRPEVGGVGGRDFVHGCAESDRARVGTILWFGRQIGNHHLGTGGPRYVDMLKGVNMSFRRTAIGDIRFDERLRGTGAQVHNEMAFSLAIVRKGWRLLYDPQVAVDHFPAARFDEDQRSSISLLATSNAAYNETLTLLEHLPAACKPIYLLWALLIGARDLPGALQCARLWLRGEPSWVRLPAVAAGRIAALRAFLFSPLSRFGPGMTRIAIASRAKSQ